MNCDDDCCNNGCNQGRNCPARTRKIQPYPHIPPDIYQRPLEDDGDDQISIWGAAGFIVGIMVVFFLVGVVVHHWPN